MTVDEFEKELKNIHIPCFKWSLSLCRQEQVAEEVLQDAYAKALNNLDSFQGNSSIKTWMFSIIRNCAYDYFRKSSRRQELDEDFLRGQKAHNTASQERNFRKKGDAEAAEYLLGKLSKREREVLELIVYQGLRVKEAAEIMGVTESSAASYLKRAKKAFKGELLNERQNPKGPSFEKTFTHHIKKAS